MINAVALASITNTRTYRKDMYVAMMIANMWQTGRTMSIAVTNMQVGSDSLWNLY